MVRPSRRLPLKRVSRPQIFTPTLISKLDILYTIYDPWLRERLDRLETELAAIADSRTRLLRVLTVLWRDIPEEANGFANNIMQAISGLGPDDHYDPSHLAWYEAKVGQMIFDALPPARRSDVNVATISHLMFMAFDGLAITAHVNPRASRSNLLVDQFCALLLGQPVEKNRHSIKTPSANRPQPRTATATYRS